MEDLNDLPFHLKVSQATWQWNLECVTQFFPNFPDFLPFREPFMFHNYHQNIQRRFFEIKLSTSRLKLHYFIEIVYLTGSQNILSSFCGPWTKICTLNGPPLEKDWETLLTININKNVPTATFHFERMHQWTIQMATQIEDAARCLVFYIEGFFLNVFISIIILITHFHKYFDLSYKTYIIFFSYFKIIRYCVTHLNTFYFCYHWTVHLIVAI